jgi:hypothetical protein
MDYSDDIGRFDCKQRLPDPCNVLAQQVSCGQVVRLAPDGRKQSSIGNYSTEIVEETSRHSFKLTRLIVRRVPLEKQGKLSSCC